MGGERVENRMKNAMSYQRVSSKRSRGQTLIAAMIVLGVMMIIGFVFLGIINRNIFQTSESRKRSQSYALAEAGIRYVHKQLLDSDEGADFRPVPTLPISSRDPDLDYLRPDPDSDPSNGDQGGPDGLGGYTRVNYGNGRFVVRVRYGPSDAVLFSTAQNGPLRQPGRARNYIIIESVGRIGRVNANDPTTTLGRDNTETTKLVAFASIGLIESTMYITGSDRTSNVAEIGSPRPFGVSYLGAPVDVPVIFGGTMDLPNYGGVGSGTAGLGGSLYSNMDLVIHGPIITELNQPLGDNWLVAGLTVGANDEAHVQINRSFFSGTWQTDSATLTNAGAPSLDSRSNAFSTLMGLFRDGYDGNDPSGYWRNVGPKAGPSIVRQDPETNLTRYFQLTRNSGRVTAFGQEGSRGHGSGIYVNNTQDLQMRTDEDGRADAGSSESLLYDWFHPNNGQANSGWIGPYYIPRGAYVLMDADGFNIIRDGRATGPERTWRTPDGADTGTSSIRFRVGTVNGVPYIINSFTPGANIGSATPNFAAGRPFNGVLYFEGNVRIRGIIPTDVQMTVVSNATIYVEGSITKGVLRNLVTDPSGPPAATRLNRPSRSMLMLMAKDYVAINPTMFFGPIFGQSLEEVSEEANPVAWNPLRIRHGGSFDWRFELLWNTASGSGPSLPNSWESMAEGYRDANATNSFRKSMVVLSHATDDGAAPWSFMSMQVNYGLANPDYFFEMVAPNAAAPYFQPQPYGAIYGLGSETWQRYPKFETTGFTLFDPATLSTQANGTVLRANAAGSYGDYMGLVGDMSDILMRHNQLGAGATNDYLLARAVVLPFDVRIEASMFAEQGSFVVIPGNWFNPNPNDTREAFELRVTAFQGLGMTHAQAVARAIQERRENYGSGPEMPFHQEPLDVKIGIFGSISQNIPLPMSYQGEWLRKWGWIPKQTGYMYDIASDKPIYIPTLHNHPLFDVSSGANYVPNLIVSYDPALGTASAFGFGGDYIRRDSYGRPLAPMPALPVSPVLSYFGEVLR